MTITLEKALRLVDTKKQRISDLRTLRSGSAVISYEDGLGDDFIQRPDRKVADITAEMQFLQGQIEVLMREISLANLHTLTDFTVDDHKQPLGTLIVHLRYLRDELPYLKRLSEHRSGKAKKNDRQFVGGQLTTVSTVQVTEVLYNPKEYEATVRKMEREIDAMQDVVTRYNQTTTIDYEDAEFAADVA